MLWLAVSLVILPLAVEARRAARNERQQIARGGVEPTGDVYGVMRWAYPAAFGVMLLEGAQRGVRPGLLFDGGVAVFALAKALKWWAIVSLGSCWTFRVIVVPGTRLVTGGPYRLVRHPNYIAVAGELAGVMLMTGAFVSGPVTIAAFSALMVKRVAVERRALDAILRET